MSTPFHNIRQAVDAAEEVVEDLAMKYEAEIGALQAQIADLKAQVPSPASGPLGVPGEWVSKFSSLAELARRTGYPWGPQWSTNEGNREDQAYVPANVEHLPAIAGARSEAINLVAKRENSPVPATIVNNGVRGQLRDGRRSLPFTSGAVNTKGIAEARFGF
ncbi:hypothetical protein [Actinomycetospora straminea]|uniref:Uncharacterized protein n=1 Tax=Actinomycetospora straminea TaxID=663607 RepID=A0ABP9F6N2_9PSEU|nr:hypothetical protein [Actinomycetospora straminea]MDD7936740.1 hypothetical protein [Actinomycetospora straminea]